MSIVLELSAELEERLRQEATRRGLAPDAFAAQVLDQHLPAVARSSAEQAAALRAMVAQWEAEDSAVARARDEAIRRIGAAKTVEEWIEAASTLPSDDDDGYDLLQALDENRRLSGDIRMLFPPEMKGISW